MDQLLVQYWLEGPQEDKESSASLLSPGQQTGSAASAAAQVLLGQSSPRGPILGLNGTGGGSSSSSSGDGGNSSLGLLDQSKIAAAQIVLLCNDVTTAVGKWANPNRIAGG